MRKKFHFFIIVFLALLVFLIYLSSPKAVNKIDKDSGNKIFFTDVSQKSGLIINARNNGVAWADFDQDGFDDIFISTTEYPSRLFRNVGGKKFEDVTGKVGIGEYFTSSAVFLDLENDGDLDLLINIIPSNENNLQESGSDEDTYHNRGVIISAFKFYRNDGGRFSDITEELGLSTIKPEGVCTSIFGDIDDDGFLDLFLSCFKSFYTYFLSNLRDLEDETLKEEVKKIEGRYPSEVFSQGSSIDNSLAIFALFPGNLHLFKNTEGKKFTDYTSRLPNFNITSGRYFQPIFFDHDNDGLLDIFIAIDFDRSFLFKNKGNFTFSEVGEEAGFGEKAYWMGVDVGDYDNDGLLDLYVTNARGDGLFKNQGFGKFELVTKLNRNSVGWGTVFLDFNNDGSLDIFTCNGDTYTTSIQEKLDKENSEKLIEDFIRQNILYRNTANDFIKTGQIGNKGSCKGTAISDFDNDGFSDIYVANISDNRHPERSALYRNLGNDNSWIKIKLDGKKSNKFGVGAKIQVKADSLLQTKLVTAGNSFFSQSSFEQTFGFGSFKGLVSITVYWPSGIVQELKNVKLNRRLLIVEKL